VRTLSSVGENNAWSHEIRLNAFGQFESWDYDQAMNDNPYIVGSTYVQSNVWYHVAVTAQNGGMKHLYVNGVEEGTPAPIDTLWAGGDEFAFATGAAYGSFSPEPMLLDDVGIWYAALSPQAIALLASGTHPSAITNSTVQLELVNPQLIASGTLNPTTDENIIQPQTFAPTPANVTARYLQFNALTGVYTNFSVTNVGLNEIQVMSQVDNTPPNPAIQTAVLLSWPASPFNFVLQSTPTLSPANWTAVSVAPTLVGTNLQVYLPASQQSAFYRLTPQ
jgi:hypothetical protein